MDKAIVTPPSLDFPLAKPCLLIGSRPDCFSEIIKSNIKAMTPFTPISNAEMIMIAIELAV